MKNKRQKVKLEQIDWVNFTPEEQNHRNSIKDPQDSTKNLEDIHPKTDHQILIELGQLDLLD